MRTALSMFLVICLICSVTVLLRDRQIGPPKDGWGKPSNGIQAMVYATRPIARPGQRCDIHLRIRNAGKHRRVLDSFPYMTNKDWSNWRLQGEEIGNQRLWKEPTITLEPGEVKDLLFRTRHSERLGIYGYSVHLSLYGGIQSNKLTMLVVPGNAFWIALIALESAALYVVRRRRR